MNDQIQPLVDITVASTRQTRVARLALALFGAGMFLSASVFLLGGGWSQAPVSGAAAEESQEENNSAVPADALATSEADRAALLSSTATPQPTPTFTPVPPRVTLEQAEPQDSGRPSGAPASQLEAPAPVVVSQPPASSPCPTQGISGFAFDLFNEVNNSRAQYGMGPLAADGCVTHVAQLRSDDMAGRGYFAHVSPDGSSAFTLLDAYAVPSGWAGENLARNNYPTDQTVAVAIRDLMASPAHRDNILNPNYTSMGVAVTLDGTGIYYYTMIFTGPA